MVTIDLTDEALARQCVELRDTIRAHVRVLRERVSTWVPKPMPPDWR